MPLVLSRKEHQRIYIGTPAGPVWVEVVRIDRGRVRLGITADPSIIVTRAELLPPRDLGRLLPTADEVAKEKGDAS